MKVEFVLNLNSITDASHFVSEISKTVACDVDVSYGRHCVDAKSLMGVMSLSCHDVKAIIDNPTCKEDLINFNDICKKYEVKTEE